MGRPGPAAPHATDLELSGRRRPAPRLDEYLELARRACFVCEVVAGNPRLPHHVVYEDEIAIAFLNRFPTLAGATIIALQTVVHRVGEAVRRALPTERLYVLSLGSQRGNRHVHWHLVPLPPGVPFEQQQLAALDWSDGILDLDEAELAEIATRIRALL